MAGQTETVEHSACGTVTAVDKEDSGTKRNTSLPLKESSSNIAWAGGEGATSGNCVTDSDSVVSDGAEAPGRNLGFGRGGSNLAPPKRQEIPQEGISLLQRTEVRNRVRRKNCDC